MTSGWVFGSNPAGPVALNTPGIKYRTEPSRPVSYRSVESRHKNNFCKDLEDLKVSLEKLHNQPGVGRWKMFGGSAPAKVLAGHLVELEVKGSVEVSEPEQNLSRYLRMRSALRLPQAARPAAALRLLQAGETFGLVEVEVFVRHHAFEAQKVLDSAHLPRWVCHQPLPAYEQEARQRKVAQPVLQVLGVDADAYGAPGRVDERRAVVAEGEVLERWKPRRFGQRLGVIRDGPGHWVTHHHDEFGVAAHGVDAPRSFFGDEVTWSLFHGDLTLQSPRH